MTRPDWKTALGAAIVPVMLPWAAEAQTKPGTRLDVRVHVEHVAVSGDEVEIVYRLCSAAGSVEDLLAFTVEAPAAGLQVEVPEPADAWATATRFRGGPVARWAALEPVVPPGGTSPRLRMRAAGLPAVVRFWVQGYAPPAELAAADTAADVPADDPLAAGSRQGLTIGVEAAARDASLDMLADRLVTINATVCTEVGWIRSEELCRQLGDMLVAFRAALAARPADIHTAVRRLEAYADALRAEEWRDTVSAEADWLLRLNADALRVRLQR